MGIGSMLNAASNDADSCMNVHQRNYFLVFKQFIFSGTSRMFFVEDLFKAWLSTEYKFRYNGMLHDRIELFQYSVDGVRIERTTVQHQDLRVAYWAAGVLCELMWAGVAVEEIVSKLGSNPGYYLYLNIKSFRPHSVELSASMLSYNVGIDYTPSGCHIDKEFGILW